MNTIRQALHDLANHPETGINAVCLTISAVAPALALNDLPVGLSTGFAIALALFATIRAQRHSSGRVRRKYMVGAWFVRVFAAAFEQMAYADRFALRDTLPFGFSATQWAWAAVVFMAALDLWALSATSARSQAQAEATAEEDSYARVERMQREKERAETERKAAELAGQIELAKIQAEAETRKAEAIAKAEAEAAGRKAEAEAEAARARAEARRKATEAMAEARKFEAEVAEREAEAKRKQEEEARKRAEAKAEAAGREAEARQRAETAQLLEKQRVEQEEAERLQQKAEAEKARAEAEAEVGRKWREANAEARTRLIAEAEAALVASGQNPTRELVGRQLGVSDKTIRSHVNQFKIAA